MNEKRIIVLVDDMFSSADDFWSVHSATRDLFEEKYDLRVFDYRPEENFRTEYPRIKEFLEAASGTAQIALLDVQFPDAPRGGLQILRYLKRRELDIPLILVVSASHDQGLAMELAGLPFVHRHESLDLQAITRRLDELFSTESLDHPERGILITHGTDTLSYVVEFLRYGVRDPGRTNIIVTGSQIPMGEGGAASDAIDNVRSGILLLQHLYAPQVGVVFNRGEQFFRSNIQKISKWHPMAFGGTCDVDLDWDQFKANDPSILLRHAPPPLKDLVLLRTGGTIESVHVEGRGYIPGADSVSEFITGNLARHYNRFSAIPFTSLDSSNMTFSDWVRLLELLQKECDIGVDTGF